jgi:hypothetical protein
VNRYATELAEHERQAEAFMKALLSEQFEAARRALLDSALAMDTRRSREAEYHMRNLWKICDALHKSLAEIADNEERVEKNRNRCD